MLGGDVGKRQRVVLVRATGELAPDEQHGNDDEDDHGRSARAVRGPAALVLVQHAGDTGGDSAHQGLRGAEQSLRACHPLGWHDHAHSDTRRGDGQR